MTWSCYAKGFKAIPLTGGINLSDKLKIPDCDILKQVGMKVINLARNHTGHRQK